MKHDGVLDQRVRTDHHVNRAIGQTFQDEVACLALLSAGQDRYLKSSCRTKAGKRFEVLAGKHLCRCHQRALRPTLGHIRHGQKGHQRLTSANIALQQPHHTIFGGKVGAKLSVSTNLRTRQRKGQGVDELLCLRARTLSRNPLPVIEKCRISASAN